MTPPKGRRSAYPLLTLAVAAYLALALAYARTTPPWQAPDEPAHYNYVAYLADRGQLPVLQPGDYPGGDVPGPHAQFGDISAYRYESHQPPLFYALGAVVYKLHASLFALRALSALFGAALLPVAFWCTSLVFPAEAWLGLGVAAFAGLIPMHLFDAGSVQNDSLADLVIAVLLLAYLAIAAGWRSRWRWPALGLLLGLAALTKATIYLPAVLLAAAALGVYARDKGITRALRPAFEVAAAALAVSGWWFIRNGLIYGWNDVLVQTRQAQVAGSQEHTGALGPDALGRFVATGFHSFWGQFGWMSVPLPERDYRGLIALTALAAAGVAAALLRHRGPACARLWLGFGLTLAGVAASVIVYNLTFLQPQGRYFFPALVPIALFYVGGVAALFPSRLQPAAVAALSVAMLAFSAYTLQHDLAPAFR